LLLQVHEIEILYIYRGSKAVTTEQTDMQMRYIQSTLY